jgi:hypothetical protein
MKWVGGGLLVLLLALPASRGDDPPKDKDGKKEASPRERYDALVKEFAGKRRDAIAEINKAKGEEQQALIKQYRALGGEFAERFLKLADENPKDPVATDALFWVFENAAGGPLHKKAADRVAALVAEMPLKDLSTRLNRTRANPALLDAVLKRAEADEKDPRAADLVAWAATKAYYLPAGRAAVSKMIEKYPDHPDMERVCLAAGDMEGGDALLKQVLAKDPKPTIKAAASLGLGKALAEKTDGLADKPTEADRTAAEAEKYLAAAVDLYKDNEGRRKDAEGELRAVRTLRVGKVAPDIKAGDLDGKEFKLSDYRGKVVLLDFWGNW